MAWLLTHMWMALVAAAVFALILGWTVRGMLLTSKMRKAIVDKDIALTELDQARDEIERLFAAQRAQRGEGGSVADASARKISDLTAELEKSKAELASLKTRGAAGAAAAVSDPADEDVPVIVRAPGREPVQAEARRGEGEEESQTLVWRNRHLEARVKHLEERLAAADAAPAAVAAAPAVAAAVPSVDEEGIAKLKWQADYLKQRVESLEAELAKAAAEAPAPAEDNSEELARLRWRNRFLEGRLAYFEGGAGEAAEAAEVQAEETAAPVDIPAEPEVVEPEPAEAEEDIVEPVTMPEEVSGAALLQTMQAAMAEAPVEDLSEEAEGGLEEATGETDIVPEPDFADVPDDEEESLDEADHADEDTLTSEEYSEEDFTESDEEEDLADEAEAETFDDTADEDETDEDEAFDADEAEDATDEEDEAYDEEDDESFDEDEDSEAVDEADEEEFLAEEDEDAGDEEDDSSEEVGDEPDEALDDAADEAGAEEDGPYDEADESDEDAGDLDEENAEDVAYESDETVLTERPLAMDGPVAGHPDDLTMIGGIGPKIQILLNELGIWHYDQIADWSPENIAWVDDYLNFNGRITREGWVEQATVLVGDAESV